MDSMEEWCKRLKIPVTEDQLIAGHYCASRHKKFLVDFGVENVESIADNLFDQECDKIMIQ
jgi:hypothetical protein